jgi:CBS-domain-containing membrane protein
MTHTSPPDPAADPPDDAPASPWSAFEAAYRGVVSLDRLMLEMGVHHLLVVDDGGLVGIIDTMDVCRALMGSA